MKIILQEWGKHKYNEEYTEKHISIGKDVVQHKPEFFIGQYEDSLNEGILTCYKLSIYESPDNGLTFTRIFFHTNKKLANPPRILNNPGGKAEFKQTPLEQLKKKYIPKPLGLPAGFWDEQP